MSLYNNHTTATKWNGQVRDSSLNCTVLSIFTDILITSSQLPYYLAKSAGKGCLSISISLAFSSVQSLSCVWLFATPWIAGYQASLSITNLPESTKTHVHRVGDAIQPSHLLSCPSPPALNLSQHLGLFQWVSSSHQVANVLEFQFQYQSFQWTPRTDLL